MGENNLAVIKVIWYTMGLNYICKGTIFPKRTCENFIEIAEDFVTVLTNPFVLIKAVNESIRNINEPIRTVNEPVIIAHP